MTPSVTLRKPRTPTSVPLVKGVKTWSRNHFFPVSSRNMYYWEKYQVTKNILRKIFYKNDSHKNFCCDRPDAVTVLCKLRKCEENLRRSSKRKVCGFGKISHAYHRSNSTQTSNMTSVLIIRARWVRYGLKINGPAAHVFFLHNGSTFKAL